MCLAPRRALNKYLLYGNALLVPASLWTLYLRHHPGFPDGIGDGLMGSLYGVAFGCYILGFIRTRREQQD